MDTVKGDIVAGPFETQDEAIEWKSERIDDDYGQWEIIDRL